MGHPDGPKEQSYIQVRPGNKLHCRLDGSGAVLKLRIPIGMIGAFPICPVRSPTSLERMGPLE